MVTDGITCYIAKEMQPLNTVEKPPSILTNKLLTNGTTCQRKPTSPKLPFHLCTTSRRQHSEGDKRHLPVLCHYSTFCLQRCIYLIFFKDYYISFLFDISQLFNFPRFQRSWVSLIHYTPYFCKFL